MKNKYRKVKQATKQMKHNVSVALSGFKRQQLKHGHSHKITLNNIVMQRDHFYATNHYNFIRFDFKTPERYLVIKGRIEAKETYNLLLYYSNTKGNRFSEKWKMIIGQSNQPIFKIIKLPWNAKTLRVVPRTVEGKFDIDSLTVTRITGFEHVTLAALNSPRLVNKFFKIIVTKPYAIKEFFTEVYSNGPLSALQKTFFLLSGKKIPVPQSVYHFDDDYKEDIIRERIAEFTRKPLISIVMPVYNVDPKWLGKAVESIETQFYQNWELCIADDCSTNKKTRNYLQSLDSEKIKITFLPKNLNISGATNAAIELASGDYIALMDNDDELSQDALFEVVKAINETNADFIYSDEDLVDVNGNYSNPHYKPCYSPDLLLSHNYITHLSVINRDLMDQSGGFRTEYNGAQDYDLFLRLTELTDKIHHIAKVLYHWRTLESSTSANPQAKKYANDTGKAAVKDALARRHIEGEVVNTKLMFFYRVRRKIVGNPLISIIIPFKDQPKMLKVCLDSILSKSTYSNFEIIGVNNNSEKSSTFKLMDDYAAKDERIRFISFGEPFNFSRINNTAAQHAKGEHILMLNNDIEVLSPKWLEAMLEHSQRPEVGAVGAKLYYPNDLIQHAGVILGIGGVAGHSHKWVNRKESGYFNRTNVIQNLSAVTAACMMIKKSLFLEMEGLNEKDLAIAFNDIDLCLRLRKEGYLNVFTPFSEAYHHESLSRGYEDTGKKIRRFRKETHYMKTVHKEILENGDPYYNPNLTLVKEDFSYL